MKQLRIHVRPELRPEQYLQPDASVPLVFQPDGTVLYDDDYLTEAFAKAVAEEWLADEARRRLLHN